MKKLFKGKWEFLNDCILFRITGGFADQVRILAYIFIYIQHHPNTKIIFLINNNEGSHGHEKFRLNFLNFENYLKVEKYLFFEEFPKKIFNKYFRSKRMFHCFKKINRPFDGANFYFQPPYFIYSLPNLFTVNILIQHTDFKKWVVLKNNKTNSNFLQLIENCKNPICLHVRAADINGAGNNGWIKKHDEIFNFYINNINEYSLNKDSVCFVFSNNIEWVKNKLDISKINCKIFFVDENGETNPFSDLILMSKCKKFVLTGGGFGLLSYFYSKHKDKEFKSFVGWNSTIAFFY